MLRQRAAALFQRVWHKGFMRSGMVTGVLLVAIAIGLGIAYWEHGRGNLHKLEAKIVTVRQDAPAPRFGGKEATVLMRARVLGDASPEFTSVTALPGRGMNILQITAYVPGKGLVDLLASPSPEDAEAAMSGKDADADGQAALTMGGAFEVPWAGRIWAGAQGSSAQTSSAQAGGRVSETWHGHSVSLPAEGGMATGGLLLGAAADAASTAAMPDGGQAQAVFSGETWGGRWPSKTEVKVSVLLSSRTIELTVTARNTGEAAEPVGIGWRPRFAIARGARAGVLLRIPAEAREEVRADGAPTGAMLPVAGTAYDFTRDGGVALGEMGLDESFTSLEKGLLEPGPVAQLSDPASGYGLRMTVLSPAIKAIHVYAPANGDFVSIDPQFNLDDPLGREWSGGPGGQLGDAGMVVLAPGQTTQWRVRLEIVPLSAGGGQM